MDLPLVIRADVDVVIAIGGSPGNHFAKWRWGLGKRLVIVDPEPIAEELNLQGVTHFREKYVNVSRYKEPGERFAILDDTRTIDLSKSGDEREYGVMKDWMRSLQWWNDYARDPKYVCSSLKMRAIRVLAEIPYPRGSDIILQPYVWSDSTETRCIHVGENQGMTSIELSEYLGYVWRWNQDRIDKSEIDDEQARAVVQLFAVREDFTQSKLPEGLRVALFSISNSINGRNRVLELLPRIDYALLPLLHEGVEGLNVRRQGQEVKTSGAEQFDDLLFSPWEATERGLYVYDIRDVLLDGSERYAAYSDIVSDWFVVGKALWETGVQTSVNSQTHYARILTPWLRRSLNHDRRSLHRPRWEVLSSMGGTAVDHPRVTGLLRGKWVAVSGHMINLLLAMHLFIICPLRYLDTIESNVASFFGRRMETKALARARKANDLSEFQWRTSGLWHSYQDWMLGVRVGEVIARELGVPWNSALGEMMEVRLNQIKSKFPKFDGEGFQSAEFRDRLVGRQP
jgi:hypothetical protein